MKAWEITRKDLKLLVRDGRTFVVLLALPVLFIYIIGAITGKLTGFNEPNRVLKIAAVDQIDVEGEGQSKIAHNLFAKLYNRIQRRDGLEVQQVGTAEAAEKLYQEGDVNVALIIGPEFYRSVQRLKVEDIFNRDRGGIALEFAPPADLAEFADRRSGLEEHLAQFLGVNPGKIGAAREDVSLDERAVFTFRLDEALAERLVKSFRDRTRREKLVESLKPLELRNVYFDGLAYGLMSLDLRLESDAPDSPSHSVIEGIVWADALATISEIPLCANEYVKPRIRAKCTALEAEASQPAIELLPPQDEPPSNSRVYQEVIPGYTVLFVFFLINIMARSFIHERGLGTLRRLRIAPVRPTSLLAGKTIPFLIISLVQTALLFLFGKLFFGMEWGPGNWAWMLLPVIFSTSLAATSLGLLVATIVRTEAQVSAYANFVVLTMGLISGSIFPRDWLSDEMRNVSLATPHAWALIAYDEILAIGRTAQNPPDLAVIGQCCAALLGFSVLFFAIGTLRFGNTD